MRTVSRLVSHPPNATVARLFPSRHAACIASGFPACIDPLRERGSNLSRVEVWRDLDERKIVDDRKVFHSFWHKFHQTHGRVKCATGDAYGIGGALRPSES